MPKISQYPDGGAIQAVDELVIARSGANYKIPASLLSKATVNATITTANVTAVANSTYNLTIAGLTANRNFIIPAPSYAGQEITINILDGDDAYFVIIIGDTGVTINGGSAATEFHRLQTKNKSVTFRATSVTNWQVVGGIEDTILPFSVFLGTQPHTANGFPNIMPIAFPMRLEKLAVTCAVLSNNSGSDVSNYWTIELYKSDGTLVASVTTASNTADVWTTLFDTTFNVQNVTVSDLRMYIQTTKTGTPGDLYIYPSLVAKIS